LSSDGSKYPSVCTRSLKEPNERQQMERTRRPGQHERLPLNQRLSFFPQKGHGLG